ncbi:MAG: hypothetical protein M0029_00100 [Actinomycetota bacterium]|nr:hypothetical protein [Actinomycetota bacterium]
MSDDLDGSPGEPPAAPPPPPAGVSERPGSGSPGPVSGGPDLAARAADAVESVVALVRDRTVRPVTLAARAVVFGVVVAAGSLVLTVLLSVALVRILTVYAFAGRVWASDLLVGAVFVAAGLAAWSRRSPRRTAGASR